MRSWVWLLIQTGVWHGDRMSLIFSYKKLKNCFYTRWFDETSSLDSWRLTVADAECVPSTSRSRSSSDTWQNPLAFDHMTAQGFVFFFLWLWDKHFTIFLLLGLRIKSSLFNQLPALRSEESYFRILVRVWDVFTLNLWKWHQSSV